MTPDRIVVAARRWVGTPYHHQASSLGAGADCLGLLRGVWREVCGREPELPPAYTPDWAEPQREEVLWAAAARHLQEKPVHQTGLADVLLFRMRAGSVAKHLGIVSAVTPIGQFIHAYEGYGVVESALTDPWRRRIVACFAFPGAVD